MSGHTCNSTGPSSPGSNRRTRRRNRKKALLPNPGTNSLSDPDLEGVLERLGCYQSDDMHRRDAMDHLEMLLARWITTLPNANNSAWERPRVALISLGSYRLRVHRNDSDLDLLALSPPNCTRDEFFTSFVNLLKQDKRISQVHPIPTAYTPVIKFILNGIHVDLLFARVADPSNLLAYQRKRVSPLVVRGIHSAPASDREEYNVSDADLADLDESGVRSLNGVRVSQILLEVVPDLKSFRLVLKAVKEWANRAGVYSNVLGFLGGVNWAIMVAWVCKRYPKLSAVELLASFFRTFATWKWPTPLMLTDIQDQPPPGALTLPSWNPKLYPRDGLHVMPIITPAYPSMNSSYNVGIPQLRRIQDEMIRTCNNLRTSNGDIKCLFRKSDFFSRHEHFVQITIRATNRQDFIEWFRLVESRLRLLICCLETPEVHSWPFARFFERRYDSGGVCLGSGHSEPDCLHESSFFIGLRFAENINALDIRHLTMDFLHKVNNWEQRKKGMDLSIAHVTSSKLPAYVFEEDGESHFNLDAENEGLSGFKGQCTDHDTEEESISSNEEVSQAQSTSSSLDLASPLKRSRTVA